MTFRLPSDARAPNKRRKNSMGTLHFLAISFHEHPSLELLSEAVVRNCGEFRLRHLKNGQVITLARMAQIGQRQNALAHLLRSAKRRKLDISKPSAKTL
jgi:hypothetical protein